MIKTLDLPTAAGITYAGGDVQHITSEDANSASRQSRTSRQLAARDNLLSTKVNELIEEVNNKERIINVGIPSVSLGPSEALVITNVRIPIGFESRILNAIISSNPDNAVRLDILHSPGTFGSTSGSSLVSTLTETSGQTEFSAAGELIIVITNLTGDSATAVGDIHLTMRPTAEIAGALLVASGTETSVGISGYSGFSGYSGLAGATGHAGVSGYSGLDGTASASGADAFTLTTDTFTTVAVNTNVSIEVGSTAWMAIGQTIFIETAGCHEVISIEGSTTATVKNLGYGGSSTGLMAVGKKVTASGVRGVAGDTSGNQATVSIRATIAKITTGTGYEQGTPAVGDYAEGPDAGVTTEIGVQQVSVEDHLGSQLVTMMSNVRAIFKGEVILELPQTTFSPASIGTWTTANTVIMASVSDGTATALAQPLITEVTGSENKKWSIVVPTAAVQKVNINAVGIQMIPA